VIANRVAAAASPSLGRNLENISPLCAQEKCSRRHAFLHRLRRRESGIAFHDRWYCSPECLLPGLQGVIETMRQVQLSQRSAAHRMPLGLAPVSRGHLTTDQLRRALVAQQSAGNGRLGEWLVRLGFTNEAQVVAALGLQWGCPVFKLSQTHLPDCVGLVPLGLLEAYCVVPVQFVTKTRTLYLGFSNEVDHSLLYSMEQMVPCKAECCAISESVVRKLLRVARQETRLTEIVFDSDCANDELARITLAYMVKLGTQAVRVTRCGIYLWIRLAGGDQQTDLLFRS
jgi:Type II secretion system (T2SS), protein E, N-terminal domain